MIDENKALKQIVLDFSKCRYLGHVHQIIKQKLNLPEWYGQNMDSLCDSLTGIMYTSANITIIYTPTGKEKMFFQPKLKK